MSGFNLIHREQLLRNLCDELKKVENENKKLLGLEAVFKSQDGIVLHRTSVSSALNCVVNDLYWNEDGNWNDAYSIEFHTWEITVMPKVTSM